MFMFFFFFNFNNNYEKCYRVCPSEIVYSVYMQLFAYACMFVFMHFCRSLCLRVYAHIASHLPCLPTYFPLAREPERVREHSKFRR